MAIFDPLHVPAAYGYLEYLGEFDGRLHAAGWLLQLDGPFDTLVAVPRGTRQMLPVLVKDHPYLQAACPHIPNALHGGFLAVVPMGHLGPRDTLEFDVIGGRHDVPMGRMTIGYHRAPPQPFPPDAVMLRATGCATHAFWRATGIKACNDFRRALVPHLDLDAVARLLEWGCGAGRLTKHLIDRFPQARVHGADIDGEAVAWAAANLAGEFVQCRHEPPLPYASGHFDLVVALSVFTHLTAPYQQQWLRELHRVLRPGGVLLATAHGEFAARWHFPTADACAAVLTQGFSADLRDDNLGAVASGDYYRATFQTRAYTEQAWGREFTVVDYVEAGLNNLQDIVVLRRQ